LPGGGVVVPPPLPGGGVVVPPPLPGGGVVAVTVIVVFAVAGLPAASLTVSVTS
jgi:hypothetical protein